MAVKSFGVGFIGVGPNRSWAARAHIPALQAMADRFHVAGIANATAESGQKAATALGAVRAFRNADDLVASPEVEIVAITVKVPHHAELVTKALEAGKHVYCEWPLGRDVKEAVQLMELAARKGVHAVIGLQALRAPEVLYARDLLAQGYIGDVLSVTLVGNGGGWGAETTQANAYTLDAANGATMFTIPFGHTVAALEDLFGEIRTVSAELAHRRTTSRITETGEQQSMTAADQIVVAGIFGSGLPLSAHYRGGSNAGTGLLLEINGTAGNLQITGPMGHLQLAPLSLLGAQGDKTPLAPLTIPEKYFNACGLKGPAANVAAIYSDLYRDLIEGTHTAPTFSDGVRVHQLLAAIETAADTGHRQQL